MIIQKNKKNNRNNNNNKVRQDINSFKYELMDILKNNNMKVPDTKRGDPHQVSQQPSFLSDNKVSCALENGQVSS